MLMYSDIHKVYLLHYITCTCIVHDVIGDVLYMYVYNYNHVHVHVHEGCKKYCHIKVKFPIN